MTHSKHGLVIPHFQDYCKQVFVVVMIFIGGNGGRGRGYDPFKTWSCDTSFM